jgi:inner membrane protein
VPTIISHAIVPLALAVALGPNRLPPRIAFTGAVLAMVPDADVVGFPLGVDYAADWGHRGASHMIAVPLAFLLARARWLVCWLFLFFACASHGLLDMATSGGLGVALWWPVDTARHFHDWRPIRVSPIGADFFSSRGLATLWSELRWIWAPMLCFAVGGWALRRILFPDEHLLQRLAEHGGDAERDFQ